MHRKLLEMPVFLAGWSVHCMKTGPTMSKRSDKPPATRAILGDCKSFLDFAWPSLIQLNFFLTSLLESPLGQLFLNVLLSIPSQLYTYPLHTLCCSSCHHPYCIYPSLIPAHYHYQSPPRLEQVTTVWLYLLQGVLPQVPRDIQMLIYPSNHQLYLMRHKHQLPSPPWP